MEMNRIAFAFDIASIVASFAAFENKKRTLLLQRP